MALKMILIGGHAGERERSRFRAEAEAVARLQHPNIVQIHEVGEHDGLPFFSLEYVDGGTLDRKLNGHPLAPRQAAHLVERLARAIHAAHQHQIIHRDLKPANVLLAPSDSPDAVRLGDGDGAAAYEPKITDFGLAKKLDDAAGPTASGAILGTPSYMAPEQASGTTHAIGTAADVYALGAILYELLAGRPPFRAATSLDTVLQVLADEPVPPSRLNSKLPRDLETICLKCLHKDPARRYPSAQALADDLRRFQDGEPIVARPVTTVERAVKWAKRRPAIACLSLLMVVIIIVAFGLVFGQWRRAEDERRHAEREAEQAESARADASDRARSESQARAAAEEAKQSSEQRRREAERLLREARNNLYFYDIMRAERDLQAQIFDRAEADLDACPLDLRAWEWHYLKKTCRPERLRCVGHTGGIGGVAFSPDGKRLASIGGDERVHVWDTTTGEEVRSLKVAVAPRPGVFHELNSVVYSPDGRWLATASLLQNRGKVIRKEIKLSESFDGEVRIWEAATGKEVRTLPGHVSVSFSPDGRRVAAPGPQGTVKVWDPATGKQEFSFSGNGMVVVGVAFSPDGKRLVSDAADLDHPNLKASSGGVQAQFPGELKVWDLTQGKEDTLRIKTVTRMINAMSFRPDGHQLAVANMDGTAQVLDMTTGKEVATLHADAARLKGVVFSPDGRRLATTGHDGTVKVWDSETWKELFALHGPTTEVAYSPDGRWLAGGGRDSTVMLWDALAGSGPLTLHGHQALVAGLAFSPDGRRLASVAAYTQWTRDNTLRIWDVATGRELLKVPCRAIRVLFTPDGRRLITGNGENLEPNKPGEIKIFDADTGVELRTLRGHSRIVVGLSVSGDGKRLASCATNPLDARQHGEIKLWDLTAGRELLSLPQQSHVTSVALNRDGTLLAVANVDAIVRLLDPATGKELRRLIGHPTPVNCVAFSPDGRQLASGGTDGVIILWDVATGKRLHDLRGHVGGATSSGVVTVSYSPDGRRLASATVDQAGKGEVKIWDTATGKEALALPGMLCVAFSPDGRRLASMSGNVVGVGDIMIWDAAPAAELITLRGHRRPLRGVAYSPDGRYLASGGDDRTVRIWDAKSGDEVHTVAGHTGKVWGVAFSADGRRLASASEDKTVRLWDVAGGKLLQTFEGHTADVRAVAFSPDGHRLASASNDGTVKVWDLDIGREALTLHGIGAQAVCVAFSPDGRRVAGGGDGVVIWDVATGARLLAIPAANGGYFGLAFSPDGKHLVTGGGERTLTVWDAVSGRKLRDLHGHTDSIFGLAQSADGHRLASVGGDRAVRIWDSETGQALGAFHGHTDWVAGVAFSPDGRRLVSGGAEGTVKVWSLDALSSR